MKRTVTAYMATMPGREYPLMDAVKSLIKQVDHLVIWANNYPLKERTKLRLVASMPKVIVIHSDIYAQGKAGDIGDIGKFYFMDEWSGYVLTVDDTWIYPPDYVEYMLNKVDEYGRNAVITIHGRQLHKPIKSYYFHSGLLNLYDTLKEDKPCNSLGTGVMALHADVLRDNPVQLEEFEHTNMTDIYFGIALMKRGIPQIAVAHSGQWVKQSPKAGGLKRISNTCARNEKVQVAVCNSIEWKIIQSN